MRHNNAINHLGRTSEHRNAMLSNMASSLILHKRIATTLAKAKALRKYIEPLITKSKEDDTHSRRVVFSYLGNKQAVTELFREISRKIADRPGGYTRILKTGYRKGDSAEMCIIELVDYNEVMMGLKDGKAVKPGRKRRGTGKKKTEEKAVPKIEPKEKKEKVAKAEKLHEEEIEPQNDEVMEETQEPISETEQPETVAEVQTEPEPETQPQTEPETEKAPEAETEDKPEDKPEDAAEENDIKEEK